STEVRAAHPAPAGPRRPSPRKACGYDPQRSSAHRRNAGHRLPSRPPRQGRPMTSLAGTSARAVVHTMLYGHVTRLPSGGATPAETELMLRAGEPGPHSCPPAISGQWPDWYLVPAPDNYHFWLAWHERHGQAAEWLRRGIAHPWASEPEMTFYTGTH